MKKIIITSILALSTQVNAGTMGPVETVSKFVPFVSGEAAATWNTIEGDTAFGNLPTITNDPWGGRIAAGIANQYSDQWAYSAELGWGYYGQTISTQSGTSADSRVTISGQNKSQLYGFDVLAGLLYKFNQFGVFGKAGAMIENRYYSAQITNTIVSNGFPGTTITNMSNTQTNVFPEIKVGALYSINKNLDLSVAYMHVFGNNSLSASSNGLIPNGATPTVMNVSTALDNPTLDSVIFGLVYNFA